MGSEVDHFLEGDLPILGPELPHKVGKGDEVLDGGCVLCLHDRGRMEDKGSWCLL